MSGLAKAQVIGNLGADPTSRFTQNGTQVTSFSVAVNKRDRDGSEQQPDWYRATVWGKQAEAADRILRKGMRVYLDGRLSIDQWEGKDGEARTTVEINVTDWLVLTPREDGQGQSVDNELDDMPF